MNLFSFTKNDLDEVVFEHRNKQYGAYALRKSYDEHLLKAAASSFGLLLLFGSTFYVASLFTTEVVPLIEDKIVYFDNTVNPNIEIVPDAELVEQVSGPLVDNMHYQIVRDAQVTTALPTTIDPTQTVNPLVPGVSSLPGNSSGTIPGTGTIPSPTPIDLQPEFLTSVSKMPEFDGGEDAMGSYISHHLVYPVEAMDYQKEGRVIVAFVVQTDGSISNVQVLKGFGFGSEDAARNVIEQMPKWIPGNQNGKLVPVQLVLPLQFQLR